MYKSRWILGTQNEISTLGCYNPHECHWHKIVFLSVYEGTKSFYKEEDETKPVNVYGRSKLEAEQAIMKSWPNYAILRSSIIYGPEPIVQVQKPLPLQVRRFAQEFVWLSLSIFQDFICWHSCFLEQCSGLKMCFQVARVQIFFMMNSGVLFLWRTLSRWWSSYFRHKEKVDNISVFHFIFSLGILKWEVLAMKC